MSKQLFSAEENGRMEVDNHPLWPNENDVDEQMHTLMNEPFVLRIQETLGKRTELRGMRAALRAWDA